MRRIIGTILRVRDEMRSHETKGSRHALTVTLIALAVLAGLATLSFGIWLASS